MTRASETSPAEHPLLVVLDLDETLVHARPREVATRADFHVGAWGVQKRPGVDAFLEACLRDFEVAVWTSSTRGYASGIIEALFPQPERLAFVWSREECSRHEDRETGDDVWLKDLKKVRGRGYRTERIVVVDDATERLQRSYGNYVRVLPFEGRREDRELPRLHSYLVELASRPDVRMVEKRGWRRRTLK